MTRPLLTRRPRSCFAVWRDTRRLSATRKDLRPDGSPCMARARSPLLLQCLLSGSGVKRVHVRTYVPRGYGRRARLGRLELEWQMYARPGLSRPVEMHSSRRETPSSAPDGLKRTSENPEPPPHKASYQNFQWKIGPRGGSAGPSAGATWTCNKHSPKDTNKSPTALQAPSNNTTTRRRRHLKWGGSRGGGATPRGVIGRRQ